ncbi:hypothetical protein LINPERHAP2_LOCUS26246, partial [Linum perenne]
NSLPLFPAATSNKNAVLVGRPFSINQKLHQPAASSPPASPTVLLFVLSLPPRDSFPIFQPPLVNDFHHNSDEDYASKSLWPEWRRGRSGTVE